MSAPPPPGGHHAPAPPHPSDNIVMVSPVPPSKPMGNRSATFNAQSNRSNVQDTRGRVATMGDRPIIVTQPEVNIVKAKDHVDDLTFQIVKGWSVDDVCEKFLVPIGMGKLRPLFKKHKITGSVLSRLEKEDLKDMQILSVGDRVFIAAMIKELRRSYKRHLREEVVWAGNVPPPNGGIQYFPDFRTCITYKCCPCFSPSYHYEVSRQGLRVRENPPSCVVCCSATTNNFHDMRFMKDFDWETTLMFCGMRTKKEMTFVFLEDGQAVRDPDAEAASITIAHPDVNEELFNKIAFVWSETRLVAGAM